MKRLAIIGAGGHGKVVADIGECCGYEEIIFFDDASDIGSINGSWPVVGDINDFISSSITHHDVFVAIGNNRVRGQIYDDLLSRDINPITLIHPASVVSRRAQIGFGSIVMAGAVINAYAGIGRGAIINTSASVDHDCLLGDFVHISPGAHLAGGVKVGDRSWIGIGAVVKQNIKVGNAVTVGAGAVVLKNVLDNSTVAGIPARPFQVK